MKISLTTAAFNLVKNNFDIKDAIRNWSIYVDEIVIGTIPSKDSTKEILKEVVDSFDIPIKIIEIDDHIKKPGSDGRIKNAAHQAATHEIVLQADLDERIGGNPLIWRNIAQQLFDNKDSIKAIMLPSVNLWGSYYEFSDIGFKWYLCIKEGTYRGIVNFAQKKDGTFHTDKSDSTELLIEGDILAPSINILNHSRFNNPLEYCQNHMPFIWHLGYVDLNRRAKLNKNFWNGIWKGWNGNKKKDIGVITEEDKLREKKTQIHNIQIDFL